MSSGSEWAFRPISELVSDCYPGEWGDAPRGRGDVCVFRSTDLDDDGHLVGAGVSRSISASKIATKGLRDGDVLLEASGGGPGRPVGRVAGYSVRGGVHACCSNFFRVLRPAPDMDPVFLRWALLSLWRSPAIWRFQQQTTGIINLKLRDYLDHHLMVPRSTTEQRRIAGILDAADAAIRGTEAVLAKLLMERAALHRSLVPLDAPGAGWSTLSLGELVAGAEYGISSALSNRGAVPVLRMMNLKDGAIDLSDLKYSDSADARGLLLRPGDILFNRTNSMEHVGRTSLWRGEHPAASFASYCVRFVAKTETILPAYLVHYMNLPDAQIRIKRLATPAVQQANVNPTQLQARFKVVFPRDLAVQQRAIDVLEAADAAIRAEEAYVAKLELQKQGLMQDLLTGRVRVNA